MVWETLLLTLSLSKLISKLNLCLNSLCFSGAKILNVETMVYRVRSGATESEGTEACFTWSRENLHDNWMLDIRLYLHGFYAEPLQEMLFVPLERLFGPPKLQSEPSDVKAVALQEAKCCQIS